MYNQKSAKTCRPPGWDSQRNTYRAEIPQIYFGFGEVCLLDILLKLGFASALKVLC